MREVVLQIPVLDAEQNIAIDVKINGRTRTLRYCVEIVGLADGETVVEDRVSLLRRVIREHDINWELINIGAPIRNTIPIMFRERSGDPREKVLAERSGKAAG